MTTPIPQRLFYSIRETADLLGVSAQFIYDDIKRSQRTDHPIPTRTFGNRLRVHRSYLYPDEPANVTPFRATANDEQMQAAMYAALRSFADELIARFADQRVRKVG